MFLISSEFWPKLAHHHHHSGLTSFWVKRLLEWVVLPSLLFWTLRSPQGRYSQSNVSVILCRKMSLLFLSLRSTFYVLHFTFYTTTCGTGNRRTSRPVGQQCCLYSQGIGFESVLRHKLSCDLMLFAARCLYTNFSQGVCKW
jgi:hypothetical protein